MINWQPLYFSICSFFRFLGLTTKGTIVSTSPLQLPFLGFWHTDWMIVSGTSPKQLLFWFPWLNKQLSVAPLLHSFFPFFGFWLTKQTIINGTFPPQCLFKIFLTDQRNNQQPQFFLFWFPTNQKNECWQHFSSSASFFFGLSQSKGWLAAPLLCSFFLFFQPTKWTIVGGTSLCSFFPFLVPAAKQMIINSTSPPLPFLFLTDQMNVCWWHLSSIASFFSWFQTSQINDCW